MKEINLKKAPTNTKSTEAAAICKRIEETLSIVQNRCTTRTIHAGDILDAIATIDRKLNITQKAKEGISVDVDLNAQDFPNAYKYTPYSTHFHARFHAGSWRVFCIERERTQRPKNGVVMELPEPARVAILNGFYSFEI